MRADAAPSDVWAGTARPDDVRRHNRRRVLSAVRTRGPISRTELAGHLGLSHASVTAIASDLVGAGLLSAAPVDPGRQAARGRPKTSLSLDASAASVATVNLQLDTIRATIADYAGNEIGHAVSRIATRSARADRLRSAIGTALQEAMAKAGPALRRVGAVSVGVQGVADADGRTLLWSPITKVGDLPIADWIEDDFGVSAHVANDANLAATALAVADPARYGNSFAAILLAHGVGMGLYISGQALVGDVSSGGEFGHMIHAVGGARCRCGGSGCIEAYAGDYAIIRRAHGFAPDTAPVREVRPEALRAVADAALRGDADAIAAIDEAGTAIGVGLASLFALIDPVPVVLIGTSAMLAPQIEPPIRNALQTQMRPRREGGRRSSAVTLADAAFDLAFLEDAGALIERGASEQALARLDDELADGAHE
ncbi:MAG: ROK family transcriptional regulator [Pseudomonadota bacterium]